MIFKGDVENHTFFRIKGDSVTGLVSKKLEYRENQYPNIAETKQ